MAYGVYGAWRANCGKIIDAITPCKAHFYDSNTYPLRRMTSFEASLFKFNNYLLKNGFS